LSSKNTHWVRIGNNIHDFRTEEEKARDKRKAFKVGLAIDRMKTVKPKFKRTPKRVEPEDEKA
jgi:hypothetical protein